MNRADRTRTRKIVANPAWRPGHGSQPLNPVPRIKRSLVIVFTLFLGIGALVVANADSLAQRLNQPVTKVRMDNQWQRVSDAEVQSILARFMGVGYFDFDVVGVKETLQEHPWIRQASVKKLWPNSVGLLLTEEVAIARWGNSSVLNQYGEIFQPQNLGALQSLPLLEGPQDMQIRVMEQYRAVNQLFFPAGLRVTKLSLSDRGSWQLELNSNLMVIAGRENVMDRLHRFLEFYGQYPAEEPGGVLAVDLRYDNGLAVRSVAPEITEVAAR